jgi:hypothetical protein
VVPASHGIAAPPLHVNEHAPPAPHTTLQTAFPWQAARQPPDGQLTLHRLLPAQFSVDPTPIVTLASAPPPIETLLSGPVLSVQLAWPVHEDTQSAAQLPTHVEPPAQFVVHPVPQFTLHVALLPHVYVTLFATGPLPSTLTPPSVPPPNSHTAPGAQVHTLPSQTQPPSVVETQLPTPLAPPSVIEESGGGGGGGGGFVAVVVAAVSGPESVVSVMLVSSPHPTATTATPTPNDPADASRTMRRSFCMTVLSLPRRRVSHWEERSDSSSSLSPNVTSTNAECLRTRSANADARLGFI